MGFVIDRNEKKSFIHIPDDAPLVDTQSTDNRAVFKFRSFTVHFTYRFEETVSPPAPMGIERWKIGIVQNVLFETAGYKYLDEESHLEELPKRGANGARSKATPGRPGAGKPATQRTKHEVEDACAKVLRGEHKAKATLNMCYSDTIMDRYHASAAPFYSEPVDDHGTKTEPYHNIYYTTIGFGFSLEDMKPKGKRIKFESQATVSMRDRPEFWAPLRPTRYVPLIEAWNLYQFGIWLVALDAQGRLSQVIAHVEPFSMLYTATLVPLPGEAGQMSTSTPATDRRCRARVGQATVRGDFHGKDIQPRVLPGPGKLQPSLDGTTNSNDRDRAWNTKNFALLHYTP